MLGISLLHWEPMRRVSLTPAPIRLFSVYSVTILIPLPYCSTTVYWLPETSNWFPLPSISYTLNVVEEGTGTGIGGALVQGITEGVILDWTADGSGVVVEGTFIEGEYTFIAGSWGYISREVTVFAESGSPNLTIELEKGYYDDFALDFNWEVSGPAPRGTWERGEPVGTDAFGEFMNPEFDISTDFSDLAYVTGNGGGSAGNDDVDEGETILTSPSMDLSSTVEPIVKFHWWFNNGGSFGGGPNDTFTVTISNGITTATLMKTTVPEDAWRFDTFRVSSFLTPTDDVTVSFIAGDYDPGHWVEGGVDVFRVDEGGPVGLEGGIDPELSKFRVFPNPFSRELVLEMELNEPGEGRVEILNQLGAMVDHRTFHGVKGKQRIIVDGLQSLTTGIYFVKLYTGEILSMRKVIKF